MTGEELLQILKAMGVGGVIKSTVLHFDELA
jgi:hypothetical protein